MATPTKTQAIDLVSRMRGSDFLATFPAKFRSAILQVKTVTPGVPNTVLEDALAGDIIESSVTATRTDEREKSTTTLDLTVGYKPDLVYHDQDFDEKFNLVFPVDRYLTARGAELGQSSRNIQGINPATDLVETIDISSAQSFMSAYSSILPGRTRVEFPPVMTGWDILQNSSIGDGSTGTTFAFGSWHISGSYSIPVHQEAEASMAVMPEFVEFMAPEKGNHRYLSTKKVVFFLPSPVTDSAVLSRLSAILAVSVTAWPNFNPQETVAVMIGREGSVRVTADYHLQDGGGSGGSTEHAEVGATGYSKRAGLTIRTTRVRPSIHADLSAGGSSSFSDSLCATADAAGQSITECLDAVVGEWNIYNLGATPGDTSIPTSGVRLIRTESELYKYDYVMIQCETLDFAQL